MASSEIVPAGGVATGGVPAGGVLTVPAGGVPAAPTGVLPTAPTGVLPTAQAGVLPTAPTGVLPTAPAGGIPTAPTGVLPTAQAGGAATGGIPTAQAGGAATGGIPTADAEERGLIDGSQFKLNRRALGSFLVVVTLFISFTVGAAFAMPMEDFVSNPDIGPWKHIVALIFFTFDILAICTSVIAMIFLTLGHVGDDRLVTAALELSAALITVTLMLMTVSFAAGISIVGRSVPFVPFAVGTLGLCFFLGFGAIMVPLFVRRVRWSHSLAVFMEYWSRMVSR